jgi:hypothetical protein
MGLVKQTLAGIEAGEPWEAPLAQGGERRAMTPGDMAICPHRRQENASGTPDFDRFAPPAAGMPAERPEPVGGQLTQDSKAGHPGWGEPREVWSELWRFSHDNLIVERRRYEAMIYELGKLGALNDYFKREHRQNKALKDKLESQWTKELDYLRQLVAKKTKKGWYRSWRQE